MKKTTIFLFLSASVLAISCTDSAGGPVSVKDSTSATGPDSAANNSVLPPSSAPGNAGNSSLADTSYHANDSLKIKH